MKYLHFTYKGIPFTVCMRRKYTSLIKVWIFEDRDAKWYQLPWRFINSKMLCLSDYSSKEQLIEAFQELIDVVMADDARSERMETFWSTL